MCFPPCSDHFDIYWQDDRFCDSSIWTLSILITLSVPPSLTEPMMMHTFVWRIVSINILEVWYSNSLCDLKLCDLIVWFQTETKLFWTNQNWSKGAIYFRETKAIILFMGSSLNKSRHYERFPNREIYTTVIKFCFIVSDLLSVYWQECVTTQMVVCHLKQTTSNYGFWQKTVQVQMSYPASF